MRPRPRHGREEAAPRTARALCSVFFEVHGPAIGPSWRPGPLPWRLPNGDRADADARRTYFQARAADVLYGARDGTAPCRWHRDAPATEILSFPGQPGRFLAIVHVDLPRGQPIGELERTVTLAPGRPSGQSTRSRYTDLLGLEFTIPDSAARAFAVSMITFPGRTAPRLPAAPRSWTAHTGWLWSAATGTPFERFCPDPEDPASLTGLVHLSVSWRALVVRDGVSFIGLAADAPSGDAAFFDWGEVYVRSLYCDICLLATLQRDALNGFADRLAAIGAQFDSPAALRALVTEVTEFRNVLWWRDVGRHGIGNDLLRQLQLAHRTTDLFERITSDLKAFQQRVEARALESAEQAQHEEEHRTRRFEHAASIAATAFGLPSLVYAALALPIAGLSDIPPLVIIGIGIGAAVCGALIGAIGGARITRQRRAR